MLCSINSARHSRLRNPYSTVGSELSQGLTTKSKGGPSVSCEDTEEQSLVHPVIIGRGFTASLGQYSWEVVKLLGMPNEEVWEVPAMPLFVRIRSLQLVFTRKDLYRKHLFFGNILIEHEFDI